MCTNIATTTRITGSAKTASGWTGVNEARLGFDHATHLWSEHALRIDFVGVDSTAVELDLASARVLRDVLDVVIAEAERAGVE